LNPKSLMIDVSLGRCHYFAGDYEQAIAACDRVLSRDGDFVMALQLKGMALAQPGEPRAAIEMLRAAASKGEKMTSPRGPGLRRGDGGPAG
jgi:tetratricopeptide (TPR) repeat protein